MRRQLLLVLLAGCSTLPRPGRPAMPDVQFRMRDFRLANGMRIIVEEDHASPLVGVFTVVGVGSSGDPEGRAGLAHLLEHLAFRARPSNKGTAWNQLEGAGVGFLNAMTSFDETVYMETGTKDLLPQLLAIEASRMLDPLNGVDQKIFEIEREVVRNELRQRGENAIGPAFNFLQEAVFPPGHRYARPIGGSHESLSTLTFDDAKQFAATHYRPSNMTMLIIGDVDLATVQDTLAKGLPGPVFQPLRPTKDAFPPRISGPAMEPPEPPKTVLLTRQSTVASPELYVVWSLPRSFDAETVLLDFVNAAANRELGEAFFSDPDIVSVGVFPVPGAEASMLVAQATLRKGDHPERSMERVLDQLVKLWATGEAGREYALDPTRAVIETEKAFSRMRNAALMQMTLAAEDISTRGSERAMSAHFTGDPLTYSRRLRALASITPSQVSTYAEKYLQRGRARGVLVMPFPPESKDTAAGATGLAPAGTDPLTTPFPPEAVTKLGRAHTGHANETIVTAKREHIVETLPNGLQVVVHKRRNSLPVVVVELTFTTGSGGTEPAGAAELAQNVAAPKGHAYGAGGDFGIEWLSRVGVDRSRIVGSGANGNLPNMLAQLSERVTTMHVDSSVLGFFKSEFADYFERTEQLPVIKAERELQAALFKGHPWGVTTGMAEQKKLGAGEVQRWFERAWSPSNAVLVVTGDLDAEATLAEVKKWLGPWTAAKDPFAKVPSPTLRSEPLVVQVTHQPNATQAQVHLSCLADGRQVSQELAQQTLASLMATSLFEKIRGELGASYGFGGRSTLLMGGVGRIDWSGSIENSRLPQAMAVLVNAVDHFEGETLTDRAIERARWDVARESTLSGATASTVAEVLTRQVLAGRKTDQVGVLFESLSKVGRDELSTAWRQCAGNMVLSIVGDEARTRAALKQAGL
ncbi:MAG: insulinase family protein [Archangium sp.]|nr:insulinase family protein [Archangium sp.]